MRWTTLLGVNTRLGLTTFLDLTTPLGLAVALSLPTPLRLTIVSDGEGVVFCVDVEIVWVAKKCDLDKIDELRAVGRWEVVRGAREWLLIPENW
jgi:hypothetical protein